MATIAVELDCKHTFHTLITTGKKAKGFSPECECKCEFLKQIHTVGHERLHTIVISVVTPTYCCLLCFYCCPRLTVVIIILVHDGTFVNVLFHPGECILSLVNVYPGECIP